MAKTKQQIVYVTSSDFKEEENRVFAEVATFDDGARVNENFEFVLRDESISEILEVDLRVMVQEEAARAYSKIKIPCIVEHAGLVFEEYLNDSYPGGLTKPMWNTLGDKFLQETHSAGRSAIAQAVVAYCNGRTVQTYVGETKGKLAEEARGTRRFYWDTVFIPELEPADPAFDLTYAEITDRPDLGLPYKMKGLSQSAKAMLAFLQSMRSGDPESLWH